MRATFNASSVASFRAHFSAVSMQSRTRLSSGYRFCQIGSASRAQAQDAKTSFLRLSSPTGPAFLPASHKSQSPRSQLAQADFALRYFLDHLTASGQAPSEVRISWGSMEGGGVSGVLISYPPACDQSKVKSAQWLFPTPCQAGIQIQRCSF